MRNVMMALTMAAVVAAPALAQTPSAGGWVATWTTALVARPAMLPPAPANAAPLIPPMITPNNQTLRQIVHTSIAGTRARVVFANTFGTAPLAIGGASIALREKDAAVVPSSVRTLTVNGRPAFRIPAGALMLTDPIELAIPARADLAIDLFLPADLAKGDSPLTMHNGANQTSYVTEGDHVGEGAIPSTTITRSWFLLARVEVMAPRRAAGVVAFGDSITDGARSTPDTNSRWPDHLARRLPADVAMMNAGIAGNRVLSEGNYNVGVNALARFERDVLAQPGVTHVIVMEGINDIRNQGPVVSATADDLITAYRQMIDRAHARGLKIYGATLTPCEGDMLMTAAGEVKRKAVNAWIRTSRAFDGVIDFDAVVRDTAQPTKIRADFDSGDHLHPNDAGYKAMADAVDLALFRSSGS